MDDIEKAVFVENPRGYLKASDGNIKLLSFLRRIIVILIRNIIKIN